MKKKIAYAVLFLLLLVAAAIILWHPGTGIETADILKWLPDSMALAALMLLGVFCLKSVLIIIPLSAIYAAAGLVLPVGWAFVICYAGIICELSLSYLWGRILGRDRVGKLLDKYEKSRRFVESSIRHKPISCALIRLTPLPSDVISMFYGASGMRLTTFLLFSIIGMTPGLIPYVLMGGSLDEPRSFTFIFSLILSVAMLVGSYVYYRILRKREGDPDQRKPAGL